MLILLLKYKKGGYEMIFKNQIIITLILADLLAGQTIINNSSEDITVKTEFIPQGVTIIFIDHFKEQVPLDADTSGQAFIYFNKKNATIYFPIKKNWQFRDHWNFILGHELGHFFIFCLRNNIECRAKKIDFNKFLPLISPHASEASEEEIADKIGLFYQKNLPKIILTL